METGTVVSSASQVHRLCAQKVGVVSLPQSLLFVGSRSGCAGAFRPVRQDVLGMVSPI
jgi:hypothetical protein